MTTNYENIYESKLAEMKEKLIGSTITTQLQLKRISNNKLDKIITAMSKVVGKEVWEDFSWRTGKILGIFRFIVQNPKHRQALLDITGLTKDYVDLYFSICGNLPYVNTTNNTVNNGKPMNIEATKEFIQVIAAQWDIVIEEDDISDITQERWDRLYKAALERAVETVRFNTQNNPDIDVPTGYEE